MVDKWISPQNLNDDPTNWCSIPHELHEQILKFQELMFPGFKNRLEGAKVHCLECEGQKPYEVITIATGKLGIVTGYIGKPNTPEFSIFVKEATT